RKFNQVDQDQAQEWLNGTGKRCGDIVGITKTSSAPSQWALSYNLKSQIAEDTRKMFKAQSNDENHSELKPGRNERDNHDEEMIISMLEQLQVFESDLLACNLQNIVIKDISKKNIQDSLLLANSRGQSQMEDFVEERETANPSLKLYEVVQKNESKATGTILKADRNFLRRVDTAYAAGRDIDLKTLLTHELMPVPLCLAKLNGNLRTGNKAMLADVLTKDIECPSTVCVDRESLSCLILDGQARVLSIGNPTHVKTFRDFDDVFVKSVCQSGAKFKRIDIQARVYKTNNPTKTVKPIRRVIESGDVPFPKSWSKFIALNENKADLAQFLSEELLIHAPSEKEISDHVWMMTGTSTKRRYIPIKDVLQSIPPHSIDSLLVFHALTGCDTTSFFYGRFKKSSWSVFLEHYDLLKDVGNGDINQAMLNSMEKFVCKLYSVEQFNSIDEVRSFMFPKSSKQENLPPTSDAIYFHFKRVHYQTCVWKQAGVAVPILPNPCTMGWKRDNTGLSPVLMAKEPIL
ncbi:hypothetical protein KUTeg_004788, partial [Tegillarca granosa]